MKLYTVSRDKTLYNAKALYQDGVVTVLKGSKINLNQSEKFAPCVNVKSQREDKANFDGSILMRDVCFATLSEAATFVTGRVANGMIVWKTENGKYVRFSLQDGGGK